MYLFHRYLYLRYHQTLLKRIIRASPTPVDCVPQIHQKNFLRTSEFQTPEAYCAELQNDKRKVPAYSVHLWNGMQVHLIFCRHFNKRVKSKVTTENRERQIGISFSYPNGLLYSKFGNGKIPTFDFPGHVSLGNNPLLAQTLNRAAFPVFRNRNRYI